MLCVASALQTGLERTVIPVRRVVVLIAVTLAASCGGDGQAGDGEASEAGDGAAPSQPAATAQSGTAAASDQRDPDIVKVELTQTGEGLYDVTVTVSSPYDTPQRYADGWRVLAPDGTELATHMLAHDHAAEQPFTRTQTGVEIPGLITEVTVEGRDQQYGYGGTTVTVAVPRDS